MQRFTFPILCVVLGLAFLLWRAGYFSGLVGGNSGDLIAQARRIGFWKLNPQQQYAVRMYCISQIRALRTEAINGLSREALSGNVTLIYRYRDARNDLDASMSRATNQFCDPTAELQVIEYYRKSLGWQK